MAGAHPLGRTRVPTGLWKQGTRPEVTGARENLHVQLWVRVGSALALSPLPEAQPRSGRARGAEPGHEGGVTVPTAVGC